MIPFKKFSDIANKVSKKLKVSKNKALELIVKAQQKGIDPLKWQSRLSFLATMTGEYDPKLDERSMSYIQKLAQMQHYRDNLWSIASEVAKKKNMLMRFGLMSINGGLLIQFKEQERNFVGIMHF